MLAPVVAAVFVFFGSLLLWNESFPPWLPDAYVAIAPFGTINSYGLFRVMTRDRPELVIEGSRDGEHWLPYAFKWKPGDPARAPGFVAPYMPRLDWQMWFAALGDFQQNQRLVTRLSQRLLEGSPPVLGLLAVQPFSRCPAALRARGPLRLSLHRPRGSPPDPARGGGGKNAASTARCFRSGNKRRRR